MILCQVATSPVWHYLALSHGAILINDTTSGCNIACDGCTGPGYDKCTECNDGYMRNATECVGKSRVKCVQASETDITRACAFENGYCLSFGVGN